MVAEPSKCVVRVKCKGEDVALGTIVVSLSYRYLPVFPQERELNPIDPPQDSDQAAADQGPAETADAELKPAQA